MEDKKICPYCGEEILAVAIKCKHCGEWLEKPEENIVCPICGEENPNGTVKCIHCHESINEADNMTFDTTSEFEETDLSQFLSFKCALPLSILVYAIVCYIGGYAAGVYNMFTSYHYDLLGMLPYTTLVGVGIVLWIGFAYSKKFTDAVKTRATLRAWLALGIGYIWWAFSLVLACWFNKLGLLSSCDDWLKVSYVLMLILGVVVWLILKFRSNTTLDEMIKFFVIFNIAGAILTAMAVIIQFGPTSFYPGVHL